MKTDSWRWECNVLGCMGFNEIGPLIEVNCNLTAKEYISQILQPIHRKFGKKFQRKDPNGLFMQVTRLATEHALSPRGLVERR